METKCAVCVKPIGRGSTVGASIPSKQPGRKPIAAWLCISCAGERLANILSGKENADVPGLLEHGGDTTIASVDILDNSLVSEDSVGTPTGEHQPETGDPDIEGSPEPVGEHRHTGVKIRL